MPTQWRLPTRVVSLERTLVMGIVNVTPDSFSDGGAFVKDAVVDVDGAVAHGERLVAQGADLLDVGGESTRPGAEPVTAAAERARVVPVIERLAKAVAVPISIDTMKADVAAAALAAGATIVNDVTAGTGHDAMLATVAQHRAGVVLMHMRGEPRTMQDTPHYDDVATDVAAYLRARVDAALRAGIARDAIVVDPGVGFGKTVEHNAELLARLDTLAELGLPILVGASRKSFIAKVAGDQRARDRVAGTVAAHTAAILNGARIVRAHDVAAAVQGARVADAIRARQR